MAGYLPAAAAERAAQYAALGLSGPEALYRDVPESVRLTAPLNLPPPQSELEARREAEGLARGEAEAALCANACLLARALERGGQPVFADGGAALAGLSAREIGALAGRWAAFDRAENPSPEDGEERLEGLKKAWSTRPMSAFAGVCSNALARFRRRSGPNR